MAKQVLTSSETLYKQCKRMTDTFEWEVRNWGARHMAIAVMRTVLEEFGCKEELGPEHAETREKVAKMIEAAFTAPINFQRTWLVNSGLAPVKTASALAADGIEA